MSSQEDCFHLGAKAVIVREGRVLLIKLRKNEARWDIPGGRLHKGESVEDGLRREVFEETGIQTLIEPKFLTLAIANIRIPLGDKDVGLALATYRCSIPENAEIVLSDEHTHYEWRSPKEAASRLEHYSMTLTNALLSL